jgi:G:T-mismatch repair DNA endonuclease (very short patch repair protein)
LRKDGLKIINVWECDLRPAKVERTLAKALSKIPKK